MESFIKGADISTLPEVERCGGRFFDGGAQEDAIEILKRYGVNAARLRLWVDPYDEKGRPYGAGTNDLQVTTALLKRCAEAGLDTLLDIHYSDFWADPGKQYKPKAWRGLSVPELEEKVYEYTLRVMESLEENGASPSMVQVGNELSNGLLWDEGKVPEYEQIARFVSCGIRGVRQVVPKMPIMIHLDNGGNNELYRRWFDHYFEYGGEDFDVIGLSYYPFWHGTLEGLRNNLNDIALRYRKDLIVAEVSMGFSMEDYRSYEGIPLDSEVGMATKPELVEKIEHPMTPEGQSAFMRDFLAVLSQVPEGRGKGFYYWEPCWIPVPGSGWATKEALAYMGERADMHTGNEWANQALFDYEGNALPALRVIRDFPR